MAFDRAAHCRRIASRGGRATVAKHGSSHMRKYFRSASDYKLWLGSMGAAVYAQNSGLPDTGKYPHERPPAPWDDGFTEF